MIRLTAEIERRVEEIPLLDRALMLFLESEKIEGRPAYVAKLVLEEIARNLVQHAEDVTGQAILLDLALRDARLVMGLEDESAPYDPRDAEALDLEAPLEQRRAGGMGLHLVRTMADELHYRHEDGRNRLEVEIALETS